MTYVVLVILIALWAIVLVPPYLKDRRAAGQSFRSMPGGSFPGVSNAQRFLPLQHASGPGRSTSAALAGPAVTPISAVGGMGATPTGPMAANVVPLHPLVVDQPALAMAPLADEAALQQAFEAPNVVASLGSPHSTSAARERRRQLVMALSGLAFLSLMLAIFVGGLWVAAHVFADLALLGYVILLVRRRQLAFLASAKIEPIRPPVTEVRPSALAPAPSYLLRSGT